jgi:hypothetical protein
MGNETNTVIVKITFKRIQQFLFAVPRLKAMIGANTLLGEAIREKLSSALDSKQTFPLNGYIKDITFLTDSDDPLKGEDNPINNYKKGIISQDGGHFHVAFKSLEAANDFINSAKQIIASELPGVQIEATINNESSTQETNQNWGENPTRLPQFQICQDTGNELATNYNKGHSPEYTSQTVKHLEKKTDDFKKDKTKDIIGLLNINSKKELPYSDLPIADDLKKLAGSNGYIAVIHADGNSMGIRRKHYAGTNTNSLTDIQAYMQEEVKNEQFFYAMRSAIRASVVEALKETFKGIDKDKFKCRPYHLLMLGGDDLLLITRPEYAFPFTIHYSKQLQERNQIPYGEQPKPISIGAGIAIAHHAVPFYHLHTLAENLADSAKKLYRSQHAEEGETPQERSVVDWMVATTSWIDDIEQTRRLYDLDKDGTHCITAKPYFVLPKAAETEAENDETSESETDTFTLKQLWDCADNVQELLNTQEADDNKINDENKLARSQLKNLLQSITTFDKKTSKEKFLKIKNLPDEILNIFLDKSENIEAWKKLKPEKQLEKLQLWKEIGTERYLTQYKDMLELIELHYLGKQVRREKQGTKADTGEAEK